MNDGMSFDKYIDNPSGAGSSAITNRSMYKEMYKKKFDTVLLREQGKIVYEIFKDDDKEDSYYIYMKIPSEVIENFYYDVVVRLYTKVNAKKANNILRSYAVQFYSNDPAFVYTFAHSFSKNKLFIDDLAPKMSKQALNNKATVKNPKDEVWYVKSLYFAYLTMEKYNLFNRYILDKSSKKYSKNDLIKKITDADTKIKARQEAQKKLDAKKKTESNKSKNNINKDNKKPVIEKPTKSVKYTKNSKTTKKTSITKTVKNTNNRKNHK